MNGDGGGGTNVKDFLDGGFGDDLLNGDGNDDVILGGAGNDTLVGGAGGDTLNGGGGNDHMTGGSGDDTFVFDTASGPLNKIQDFADAGVTGGDVIALDQSYFGALTTTSGPLTAGEFQVVTGGASSSTGTAVIVYNSTNGGLYYDADANGGGTGVLITTVNGSPDGLDVNDFDIFSSS